MNSVCDENLLNYEFQSIPSIKLMNANCVEYAPGNSVHNYYKYCVVVYCYEGEGYITSDNTEFNANKGDLFIFHQGANSIIQSDAHNQLKIMTISLSNFLTNEESNIVWKAGKTVVKLSLNEGSEIFEKMFNALINQSILCKSGSDFLVKSQVMDIISFLLRELNNINNNDDESVSYPYQELIREILEYIENNYNKSITLYDIARHVYRSVYYVSHVFKKNIGTSPMQYVLNLRMEKGINLLKSSQLSIGEIAYSLGYDDIHYFSNTFKRYSNMSPSRFREIHNQNKYA